MAACRWELGELVEQQGAPLVGVQAHGAEGWKSDQVAAEVQTQQVDQAWHQGNQAWPLAGPHLLG